MKIEKQVIVNKSIEEAWEVLRNFANADVWASPLIHSEGKGDSFNGCECSERICDIKGMGRSREKLIQFSHDKHSLSYVVEEGMPKMVRNATNTWWLTSLEQNKTELNMKMEFTMSGLMGMIMQPIMIMMMSKMGKTILADFKYYVENGRPSEAKLKNK